MPLVHSPGHAQVDFGEAVAVIAGVERKANFFALKLPHSDTCFVKAFPAETSEAFCDGHAAFAFFGGVPRGRGRVYRSPSAAKPAHHNGECHVHP